MKHTRSLFLFLAVLILYWCGGSSITSGDADTTTDPSVEETLQDTPVEDSPPDPFETTDTALDEEEEPPIDLLQDETVCPDPPPCEEPLALGMVNIIDENGCVMGYCCTGIDVELSNVLTITGEVISSCSVIGTVDVENTGDTSVIMASLDCELRDAEDDSLIGDCDPYPLVSGDDPLTVSTALSFELTLDCDVPGTLPCGRNISVACTYRWETIGCYSDGEWNTGAETFFVCPP